MTKEQQNSELKDREGNRLYSLSEIVEEKEIKRRRLMYLINTGRLNAKKVGWQWVVAEDEVKDLVRRERKREKGKE